MSTFNDERRHLLKWMPPLVSAVALPVHAQTSPTTTAEPTTTPGSTTTAGPTTTGIPLCVNNVLEQDSIPETPITWSQTLTVAQYNGPGTLSQVIIRVFTNIRATVGIENEDLQAQSYTSTLNAMVDVTGPASLSVPVSDARTVALGAADGTQDFAGLGGTSFTLNPAEQSSTTTVAPGPFVGAGSVSFTAAASGTVTVTGSSANTSQIATFGDARIEVEYICS